MLGWEWSGTAEIEEQADHLVLVAVAPISHTEWLGLGACVSGLRRLDKLPTVADLPAVNNV